MLIGRRLVVSTTVMSTSRGRPVLDLALMLVWAAAVTLIADAFIRLPGASAARIDLEFSLSQGMPGNNGNKAEFSLTQGMPAINTETGDEYVVKKSDGNEIRSSRFSIESEISQTSSISSKEINSDGNVKFIPSHRDLVNNIDDKRSINTDANRHEVDKSDEEMPSIMPFVERFERARKFQKEGEKVPSESIPFTSMDLFEKKRSQTKKISIKHVLKVTNDVIQPSVHMPGSPLRFRKRTSGLHTKSVTLQIDPSNGGKTSNTDESIPKVKYDLKDDFYTLDSVSSKTKRQTRDFSTPEPPQTTPTEASTIVVESSSSKTENIVENDAETNIQQTSKNSSSRSTDPLVAHSEHQMSGNSPQIPLGQIETMEHDVPGEPLNPMDFLNADKHVHETIDTSRHVDPTTMAERFEGDIELVDADVPNNNTVSGNPPTSPRFRSAIVSSERLWPNGTVPYVISSTYKLKERAIIALAFKNFHLVSCVRFVPLTNQRDYIHFIKGDGCSSTVGRIGGPQAVSLGPGCLHAGVVMHELMHALGFWHEQSRSDRDRYVNIRWENIQPGKGNNFLKYDFKGLQHVGLRYDLDSLMHYSRYAFALNRSVPTVEAITGNQVVGQRKGLSEQDCKRLIQLYPCPNATAPTIFPNIHLPPVTIPPPTPGKCHDSDYHCPQWTSDGECDRNASWMKLNCKKSCKQCGVECQDLNLQCEGWREAGECERNAPYMNLYCPLACKMCPSDIAELDLGGCKDKNKYCVKWATAGNCEQYPGYMDTYCRKACQGC